MHAVVVPSASSDPIHFLELPEDDSRHLDALQSAVDGNIEVVAVNAAPELALYVNEEGKYTLTSNARATSMLKGFLAPHDFVSGPLVITGFDPDTGSTVDLPDALPRFILDELRVREVAMLARRVQAQ